MSHKLSRAAGLLFAAAFATLGAYLLISAHAATTEQPSVSWKGSNGELLNRNANLCLGTLGNTKPAAGTKVIIESCNTIDSEKWSLVWGSGTIKSTTVVNGYGQCLDDQGSGAGVGTTVKIGACAANDSAQVWTTGYGDGTIRIDGLCLGVSGNSQLTGANTILTPCNTPVPSVHLTAPVSGSTVSGTATVTASASISQDSIAKITLEVGSTVLKTCMSTASCSTKWDTTAVNDGAYTLTAVATGTLGGTATVNETVTASNASSSEGSGSGNPGDNGGSGSTGGDTTTCDPSDPTCNDVATCDPSDPTCGGDTTTCDPSDPTCSSSPLTDTTESTSSSGSQASNQSPRTKSKKATEKLGSSKASAEKILGVSASLFALIILGFLAFMYLKRRKQVRAQPAYDSSDFFAHVAPSAGSAPGTVPPASNPPATQSTQELPPPKNVYGPPGTGSNWWMTNAGQPPAHPAGHDTATDQPPDMFEEGRKRLEEEDKEGRIKL